MKRRNHDQCWYCGASFAVATPAEICAYLDRAGWTEDGNRGNKNPWRYFIHRGVRRVRVPMMRGAIDWMSRYRECLADIRKVENRPIADIAHDMISVQERIEHAENEMVRHGTIARELEQGAKP